MLRMGRAIHSARSGVSVVMRSGSRQTPESPDPGKRSSVRRLSSATVLATASAARETGAAEL